MWEFFRFDLRYQLRAPFFWIGVLVFGLIAYGAMASDDIILGQAIGNVHRNAPNVIITMLTTLTIMGMFLAAAFIGNPVLRDHEFKIADLFHTSPMRPHQYLYGRFLAGLVIALLIYTVVALAMRIGLAMPWLDPERLGPHRLSSYVYAMLVFVLPNTFFVGALLLVLATRLRSMLGVYLGVIGFFVLWAVGQTLTAELENRQIAALLDPFGLSALNLTTRYWSAAEINTVLPPLDGLLLVNRLVWIGLGLALLPLAYRAFRRGIDDAPVRGARPAARVEAALPAPAALPVATLQFDLGWRLLCLWRSLRSDVVAVVISVPFLAMLALGLLNFVSAAWNLESLYGTASYPLTYLMVERMEQSYTFLLLLIVTFYAGELVFRDRQTGISDVVDATPLPTSVQLLSRFLAVGAVILIYLLAAVACGIGIQLLHGYYDIELSTYAKGVVLNAIPFVLLGVLALFLHIVSNHKFTGYLLIVVYLLSRIVMSAMEWTHPMLIYGRAPEATYSAMNGYGHFLIGHLWLRSYWASVALLLVLVAAAFYVRGTPGSWRERSRQALQRLRGRLGIALAAATGLYLAVGSYVYYNIEIRNDYIAADTERDLAADYERQYGIYRDDPIPRITALHTEVDIFPTEQRAQVRGRYTIINPHDTPIEQVLVGVSPELTRFDPGAHVVEIDDPRLEVRRLRLTPAMQPGETREVPFELDLGRKGFTATRGPTQFVDNGTFFNIGLFPGFGYSTDRQLQDRNERRKRGLGEPERMPKLEDVAARSAHYLTDNATWIDFRTVVSTDADQIALAPGALQREWQQDGRRYFEYRSEGRILPFVAWLSARWAVKRVDHHGVSVEVYYDPSTPYNVDRMLQAARDSLDYFQSQFTPYQFPYLRILQFPRYERFAQAFAGTVPFSESIGFVADLRDPEAVDFVYYVTAHEVAHQWWAHQVMGADAQGATMLSESLAQYSALMVMERAYGRAQMRQFLKYELDRYLSERSGEINEELPLMRVENQQYLHYRKGSLVFYRLREEIGEAALNAALKRYLEDKGFQEPPFTVSTELLDYIEAVTPADQRGLLDDLFRTITFYDNRVLEASAVRRADGKYEVTVKVSADKRVADGEGNETAKPIYDWIELGVFARDAGASEREERVLSLERKLVTGQDATYTVVVDERPHEVGFDPYNKLIDRVSDDNRKRVTLSEAAATRG